MLAKRENILTYTKKRTQFTVLLMLFLCLALGMVSESSALTLLPPATITVPATDADGSYMVKWSKSPTETTDITYIVQEATDTAFTSPRIVPHATALSATITGRTTSKTYYYRVRAKKTGWQTSTWKNSTTGCLVKFRAGAPALITVPTSDADGSYEISWDASATPGVTYVLQEATNSAFTGAHTLLKTEALSTSISDRTQCTYYYRVRATKAGYTNSPWKVGGNGCVIGFTYEELIGKTYQIFDPEYQDCVSYLTFIDDSQFIVYEGEVFMTTINYTIVDGSIVWSDENGRTSKVSVLSRNDSIITTGFSSTGAHFEEETRWSGTDFSSMNNNVTTLKDWFITNGFWPDSTITVDGRVTHKGTSFDGRWWIDNNVFTFEHPQDSGCVDTKAYKLEDDILMFATDADYTSTLTMTEK